MGISTQVKCGRTLARAAAACVLGAAVSVAPARAQETGEGGAKPCLVFGGPEAEGLQTVLGGCGGTGVVLGEAEAFEAYTNPALNAVVAVLERDGAQRVLLLRPRADGLPMLEDLGAALASAAGRGPLGGTDGLALDLETFAVSGRIGLRDSGQGASETGGAAMRQQALGAAEATVMEQDIDIGAMIAADPANAQ